MPSRTKKGRDHSESREESLSVPRRLEATHPPFPFPGRLMRILCPIIQPALLLVRHRRYHFYLRRRIAAEFVGDDCSGDVLKSFQQLAKELLGGPFVPPRLNEDVEHITILVAGPPQILQLPLNLKKDFVEVPSVPKVSTPCAQAFGVRLSELLTPFPIRFVAHHDTTLGHHFVDVAKTQAESKVQPHAVADDLGGEAMAFVVADR